jgi:hypothetical protein
LAAGSVNGTNAAAAFAIGAGNLGSHDDAALLGISAALTQRRNRFALMPHDIATEAIDTPGCIQAATASALNSSLCRRRRRRPPAGWL